MRPKIITVTHFLHNTPMRVRLRLDGNYRRIWDNIDDPTMGPLMEWQFKETAEQLAEMLADDPHDAISPYSDEREATFSEVLLRTPWR